GLLNKRIVLLGWGRLAVFLLTCFGVWTFLGQTSLAFIIGVFGFGCFLLVLRQHVDLKAKRNHYRRIKGYADFELDFLSGQAPGYDKGAEFIDSSHPFTSDLDIFGNSSIFQYLNRTKTIHAKEILADDLRTVEVEQERILSNRSIISEFSEDPEFVFSYLSHAEGAKSVEFKRDSTLKSILPYKSWILTATTIILPVLSLGLTAALVLDVITWSLYSQLILLLAIPVIISLKKNMTDFRIYETRLKLASSFDKGLRQLRDCQSKSEEVKALFNEVDLQESGEALAALKKINGAIDSRNNIFVGIALNLLLLWDFQCHKRLANWDKTWARKFESWMEFASRMEVIFSYSIYVHNHSDFSYPKLSNKRHFNLKNARHLLLHRDGIPNNFSLEGDSKFVIVTGANMAGKSTFLRTVGTNMLLATKGLPIPVESMSFKPTQLFTSMVTADNLGEGESYFFSELKRLKELTSILEKDQPLFVILDEILKGTNSLDKAEGSRLFMEKLLDLPAHGLIATHDLSLCEMEVDFSEAIQNYSFEVEFKEEELHFDYKLKRGVCKNMNARFLLEKMGLTKTTSPKEL
ncbi:MAG: hypothetical protein AAGC47_14385, partial [Bacteroidota bacterium]